MNGTVKKATRLAAAAAASAALIAAGQSPAHASTTTGGVRPAGSVVNYCGNEVDVHEYSGINICLTYSQTLNVCNVDYIVNGSNWVDFYWGLGLPATNYVPGTGPNSWWAGGEPWCIGEVDINT
ncbi:hypothetical protein KGQ20_17015 [Catenulispora sp. NF23]|uniref:Secreted protein n=1 Tax=Catenulispora pinistramenti TaxID=2705254 RepID=A0ABS5KXT9_9ACTN|nr:hypothetical protein [Catenulispora pinistramenti]MBS2534475.1 hypothetical protein [Catenulispora pinistramenti]MBS2550873.1 hypothetical protein [Catenulispora pinistramenti]